MDWGREVIGTKTSGYMFWKKMETGIDYVSNKCIKQKLANLAQEKG